MQTATMQTQRDAELGSFYTIRSLMDIMYQQELDNHVQKLMSKPPDRAPVSPESNSYIMYIQNFRHVRCWNKNYNPATSSPCKGPWTYNPMEGSITLYRVSKRTLSLQREYMRRFTNPCSEEDIEGVRVTVQGLESHIGEENTLLRVAERGVNAGPAVLSMMPETTIPLSRLYSVSKHIREGHGEIAFSTLKRTLEEPRAVQIGDDSCSLYSMKKRIKRKDARTFFFYMNFCTSLEEEEECFHGYLNAYVSPECTNEWMSSVTSIWNLPTPAEDLHVIFADRGEQTWKNAHLEGREELALAQRIQIPIQEYEPFGNMYDYKL